MEIADRVAWAQTVRDADTWFFLLGLPVWNRTPLTAAEEMEGEVEAGVAARNYRDTAGPVESALYVDLDGEEWYNPRHG